MTTIKHLCLTALCACLMAAVSTAGEQCSNLHVANVKSIFAIAPSPMGKNVLLYGSPEKAEGELVTGSLFRIRLGGANTNIVKIKSPIASNPPSPVWKPDGSVAYFETDQGIYQLKLAFGSPELLWKGQSVGIAISPNGLLLAFWHVEQGADTLIVYDLGRHSETRTWKVPDRFESDKSGWDLAFTPDSRAIYARTYDDADSTPLKRFDIVSGKVEIVNPDCYAVAEGKGAVYFIAVSGATRSLHKIVGLTSRSSLVAKNFSYDSLSLGGGLRWLISQENRTSETAILDTETDAIKPIGKRELASVLSDGRLLVVDGPHVTVGDVSCMPKEHAETLDLSSDTVATQQPKIQTRVAHSSLFLGLSGAVLTAKLIVCLGA